MDTTSTILVVLVIALIIWDIFLYKEAKNGKKTISMALKEAGQKYPSIIIAVSILIGHWFWPQ